MSSTSSSSSLLMLSYVLYWISQVSNETFLLFYYILYDIEQNHLISNLKQWEKERAIQSIYKIAWKLRIFVSKKWWWRGKSWRKSIHNWAINFFSSFSVFFISYYIMFFVGFCGIEQRKDRKKLSISEFQIIFH